MKGLVKTLKEWHVISYFSKGKRWLVLLFCILLALVIWLFQMLNGVYTKTIYLNVGEVHIPSRFTINGESEIPDVVAVDITSKGNKLFYYTLFHEVWTKEPVFELSLDTLGLKESGGYWTFDSAELSRILFHSYPDLLKYFDASIDNISIRPDIIAFSYAPLQRKRCVIDFKGQFDLGEGESRILKSVSLLPSEVVVYGSQDKLDSLTRMGGYVSTDTSTFLVSQVGNSQIRVPLLKSEGLRFSFDTITVAVDVQELYYYEYIVEKLEARNLDEKSILRLFPSSIKVKVLYENDGITKEKLEQIIGLYVDLAEERENPQMLTIHYNKLPKNVYSMEFEPAQVEFIIEKTAVDLL